MKIRALFILAVLLAGCSAETPEDVNDANLFLWFEPPPYHTILFCFENGKIELRIDANGLSMTGDTDKMDEAADVFFNEYLREAVDLYIIKKQKDERELLPER